MRPSLAGLLAIVLAAPAGAGGPAPRRFEFRQTHMGAEFKLILYTTDEAAARRASDAAFARVVALDAALTDYDPDSELMRLCDQAGGPPVPVGADLFRILDRALRIARASDGAFDPTVNPVVRLWRRARRERKLPSPESLARARALVDYRNVRLDPEARTVQLRKPGIKLDLGGIAKGFAADEALAVLRAHGINSALAAAAGDIAVGAPPPGEHGWSVAIPASDRHLILHHAAVSTSGDAAQFVEIDGTRYSHIVDPRTGCGITDHATVTVVAPDAATTDALDTAAYALGPDRGLAFIESFPEAAARFVRTDGDRTTITESTRWSRLTLRPAPASP